MTIREVRPEFNYPVDVMDVTYEFVGFDGAIPLSQTSKTMRTLFEQLIQRLIPMHFPRSPLNPLLLPREQYQQLAMAGTFRARALCTWTMQTQEPIESVQMSKEGTKAIWGFHNGDIQIWDPITKVRLATLHENEGVISCVQVNGEGTRAISGSHDGTIKVWDLATRECIATLQGHTGSIHCLQIKGEARIISGSQDGVIKIWDLRTQNCLHTLNHGSSVQYLEEDRAATRLVSSSSNIVAGIYNIKIWDLMTGACITTIDYGDTPLTSVRMNVDGTKIIAGDFGGSIKIWDSATGACINTLVGHRGGVFCLHMNADETTLISGGVDKTLRIWDLSLNKCVRSVQESFGWPQCVHINREERMMTAIFLNGVQHSGGVLKVVDLKPSPEEVVHAVVMAYHNRLPNASQRLQRLPYFVREEIAALQRTAEYESKDENDLEENPTSGEDSQATARALNCFIAKRFLPNIVELYKTDRQAAKRRFERLPRPIQLAISGRFKELKRLARNAPVKETDLQRQAMEIVARNPYHYW